MNPQNPTKRGRNCQSVTGRAFLRRKLLFAILPLAGIFSPRANAATDTWAGTVASTGTNWNLSGNWNTSIPNSSSATAFFYTSTGLETTIDLNASETIGEVLFGVGGYTIQSAEGDTFTFGTGVIINGTNGSGTDSINAGFSFGNGNATIDQAKGGVLNLGGAITGGGASASLTLTQPSNSSVAATLISLTGMNTFVATIKLGNGVIGINADTALGNAANQVQFNAGSTAITGLDLGFSVTGYSRPLVVQNNSQWEIGVTSGNTVSISTNTLTLTGSVVTFEKFDSGTLQMSGASQFGTGGLNVAAGIFDLNGYPDTISSLTSVSGANVINSSATQSLLTITGGSTTVGGAIGVTGDNNIAVNYGTTSPGLLILGQANNFTGGLTITSGTVQSQTAKNNSGVFGSGDVVIDAGAALDVNGNTATPTIGLLSGAGTVTNSGTFVSTFKLAGSAADSQTFTGVITDSGSNLNLSMSGGTETLTGANTYHGTTSLSGGTLDLTGTLVNTSGVTVTGGTLNATAINGLTGSTTLTVSNSAGTANLSGSNNYSGSTSLSAGTLIVGDPNALGDGGSAVTLSGGTLESSTSGITLANTISLTGVATIGGSNALTLSGAFTNSGGNRTLTVNNTALTTLSGPVFLSEAVGSSRTLTLNGSGNATISGVIADFNGVVTHVGSLTYGGSGTLSLTGSNTYGGVTTINGGIVSAALLANGGSISNTGTSSNAASNLIMNGGTLQYTGPGASTDRLFAIGVSGATLDASGSGVVQFTNTGALAYSSTAAAASLTLTGSNTGNNTLAASIANSGTGTIAITSLTKSGIGTWVLSGSSRYTGTTTVNAGTLVVSGSITGSTATVSPGATLAGTGSIAPTAASGAAVTINGALSPDSGSIGTLTFTLAGTATLAFGSSSTLNIGLNNTGGSGEVAFNAAPAAGEWLSGGGNATLALNGTINYGDIYTIFQNAIATSYTGTFTFANITGYDNVDYTAVFAQSGNNYDLSFVAGAIPESQTGGMLLGGIGILLAFQRARRSRT